MPSNSIFGFLKLCIDYKNDGFAEFKVHPIHRNQVPLLHNTVLFLCDEGDRLMAVTYK